MRGIAWILSAIAVAAVLVLAPPGAFAEQAQPGASTLTQKELEALIEQARKKGVQIIVVAPGQKPKSQARGPGTVGQWSAWMAALRTELKRLSAEAPMAPAKVWAGLKTASPDGTVGHHFIVILIVIGLMAAALLVEWFYGEWLKRKIKSMWPAAPPHMPAKMSFLLVRFVGRLFGFALFGAFVLLAATAVFAQNKATEATVVIMVLSVITVRGAIEFWRVWLSPNIAAYRLPPLNDADAKTLFRWLAGGAIVSGVLLGIGYWLDALQVDRRASVVLLLVIFLGVLLYHLVLLGANRRIVSGLIAGEGAATGRVDRIRRVMAGSWHLILGLYFVFAWIASATRVMLEKPNAIGPSFGMVVVLVGTLTLYSIGVVLLDWYFYRRKGASRRKAAEAAAAVKPGDAGESGIIEDKDADHDDGPRGWFAGVRSFEDLAKQSLHLLVFICLVGGVMLVWGVDVADQNSPFVRLWDVILVIFLGYIAMQCARIWIQKKIDAEGGFEEPAPGEEGAAGGVSRLATLLPLFRNFILATIVAIAVMIGLSELGIDIAPLFAGAGVIGLAIGFGAQTLIRDIFSGAFFLVDDAFRKGEYIDIGDVQGTVERISVRSMQVRHHNGPLHTVPFGEIKFLTNFSRDWVMMKLKIRVTYDTDVEKLRKLIKKLGPGAARASRDSARQVPRAAEISGGATRWTIRR